MGKKILTMSMGEYTDDFGVKQQTEVAVHFSDEAAWHEMLPYFLHFLEGAGYFGVVEKMINLIGGDVYDSGTFISPSAWEPND